jgi:hypothetical protein
VEKITTVKVPKKKRQGTKGQNFGQAEAGGFQGDGARAQAEANEDYFRFSQFAVSTSIRHPECLVILAKTKVYDFTWARQVSRPLYYVATSPLCGKVFSERPNFCGRK